MKTERIDEEIHLQTTGITPLNPKKSALTAPFFWNYLFPALAKAFGSKCIHLLLDLSETRLDYGNTGIRLTDWMLPQTERAKIYRNNRKSRLFAVC